MRCRRCTQKAVINMRQHKLALCRDHFPEWITEQTERFIQKYHMFDRQERVLVAVSGGKDSLSLWSILNRLNYQADGVYIGLGIDGGVDYSAVSQSMAQQFADRHSLNLTVVDLPQTYGVTVPELAAHSLRSREKPCSICGMVKRHIMNQVARDGNYAVLVTGHNLDDEAATLFSNTLSWQSSHLLRQNPVMAASHTGLARKAKPLFRFYEREMAAYALVCGIEYIYDECPYAVGARSIYHKELLNTMEVDHPGLKQNFFLSFLQAREAGLFARPDGLANEDDGDMGIDGETLYTCPNCGQPTTSNGLCTFCRLMHRK